LTMQNYNILKENQSKNKHFVSLKK